MICKVLRRLINCVSLAHRTVLATQAAASPTTLSDPKGLTSRATWAPRVGYNNIHVLRSGRRATLPRRGSAKVPSSSLRLRSMHNRYSRISLLFFFLSTICTRVFYIMKFTTTVEEPESASVTLWLECSHSSAVICSKSNHIPHQPFGGTVTRFRHVRAQRLSCPDVGNFQIHQGSTGAEELSERYLLCKRGFTGFRSPAAPRKCAESRVEEAV